MRNHSADLRLGQHSGSLGERWAGDKLVGVVVAGGVVLLTILIILLIILAIGSAPTWPYSRGWGYYPSGLLGVILLILIILALTGRL